MRRSSSSWDSHTGNLAWRLKSSSLTRFEINCNRNMRGVTLSPAIGKWRPSLQMLLSSLQPGIVFSYSRAFFFAFFCKISRDGETVFSLCLLILHVSPLPICLQNKESNLGIWSPMTGLDVVQMSFRMSFRSRGISKKQLYCQDARL